MLFFFSWSCCFWLIPVHHPIATRFLLASTPQRPGSTDECRAKQQSVLYICIYGSQNMQCSNVANLVEQEGQKALQMQDKLRRLRPMTINFKDRHKTQYTKAQSCTNNTAVKKENNARNKTSHHTLISKKGTQTRSTAASLSALCREGGLVPCHLTRSSQSVASRPRPCLFSALLEYPIPSAVSPFVL